MLDALPGPGEVLDAAPRGAVFLGGLFALGAAFAWALATTLWKRSITQFGALRMNFFKCLVCWGYLVLLVPWVTGLDVLPWVASRAALLLALSGVLGLALGDAFLFLCLRILGAQPASVIQQLSPIWSALLGLAFFSEALAPAQYGAIALVSAGVVLVILGRRAAARELSSQQLGRGVAVGVLSSLCNALGFWVAKVASAELAGYFHEFAPRWQPVVTGLVATLLRMTGAVLVLGVYAGASGKLAYHLEPLRQWRRRGREFLAVLCGTCLGVFLAQVSLVHAPASISVSLTSTTPLFLLPLAMTVLGERYGWRAVLGTLLAVLGIPMLMGE